MIPEKRALGEKLFFNPILTGNSAMACAACHMPSADWDVQDKISLGYPGTTHSRNSHAIVNSAYQHAIAQTDKPLGVYMNGDGDALTVKQKDRLAVFTGKANCASYHNGALLAD
ncbi:MAG: cytochrome c peroxidase [Roseobacter sp.]